MLRCSNMHLWYLWVRKTPLINIGDLTRLDLHLIYDPILFSHFVLSVYRLNKMRYAYNIDANELINLILQGLNKKKEKVTFLGKSPVLALKLIKSMEGNK